MSRKATGPTVKELKAKCKAAGLKKYSRLRKQELYELLIQNDLYWSTV